MPHSSWVKKEKQIPQVRFTPSGFIEGLLSEQEHPLWRPGHKKFDAYKLPKWAQGPEILPLSTLKKGFAMLRCLELFGCFGSKIGCLGTLVCFFSKDHENLASFPAIFFKGETSPVPPLQWHHHLGQGNPEIFVAPWPIGYHHGDIFVKYLVI